MGTGGLSSDSNGGPVAPPQQPPSRPSPQPVPQPVPVQQQPMVSTLYDLIDTILYPKQTCFPLKSISFSKEVNISKKTRNWGEGRKSFSWKMHPTLTLKIKVRVIISWAGGDSPFDSFKGIKGPPYKHPTVSAGQVRGLFPPSRVTKSYSVCLNFNPQLPNKLRQRTGGLSRDHHQFLSNRTRCFVIYEWTFSPPVQVWLSRFPADCWYLNECNIPYSFIDYK